MQVGGVHRGSEFVIVGRRRKSWESGAYLARYGTDAFARWDLGEAADAV
jgi:hypothetical protein|tara:strand:+ start:6326 stop:6472 length:147 start_codon:yes stop_codon:yes gene_type:complete